MTTYPGRRLFVRLLILALLASAPVARAAPPENRIDHTGMERAVYPPARHFEHIHMRLEIDIPEMSEPRFSARQTLTVAPIGRAREMLILDAAPPPALQVTAVSLGGRPLEFEQSAREAAFPPRHHRTTGQLAITLPQPIEPGRRIDVTIEYEARYADVTVAGLTWTAGDPRGPSPTDHYAQVHSQGQPQHNHTWFPCHDFPNERLTTELIVTVEDPYLVNSNGRLIRTRLGAPSPSGASRTTWHWLQDKPHANYLVSLVVGRFSLVALPPASPETAPVNMDGRPVSCTLLIPVGAEAAARAAFARTPEMIAYFGELLDHPYPWDKYSQAFVRQFVWGGMENTSATTLREEYARSEPGEEDDLIVHEIAHQWFGNLITSKSWEHIWLNEGWASYAEALWAEHAAGPDPALQREAYQAKIAGFLSAQRLTNRTYAPIFPAMVSNRYNAPEETFLRNNDTYAKGALVLHMLRNKIGDDAFFAGTRLYVRRFAFQQVETDDFRRIMEETSGLSLERFFDQWCYRPGLPRLNIAMEWTEPAPGSETGELTVTIEQVQRIDADNPAYMFVLPVHISVPPLATPSEDGPRSHRMYIGHISVDSRVTTFSHPLVSAPDRVDFDPDMTVAALTRITRPLGEPAE